MRLTHAPEKQSSQSLVEAKAECVTERVKNRCHTANGLRGFKLTQLTIFHRSSPRVYSSRRCTVATVQDEANPSSSRIMSDIRLSHAVNLGVRSTIALRLAWPIGAVVNIVAVMMHHLSLYLSCLPYKHPVSLSVTQSVFASTSDRLLCFPGACVGLIGPHPSDYAHALSA